MVSTPQKPDPWQTAQAQSGFNTQAAITQSRLNNTNQVTPYGSINYTETPGQGGTPQFTATTTLSPEMQGLVGTNIGNAQGNANLEGTLLGNASETLGKPLDLSWGEEEKRLNELSRNTLDPQWTNSWNDMEQTLYNRGVTPGTEAYDRAYRDFNTAKSGAYNDMYLRGHNTAVNDLTSMYNSPLNALTALRGNSQVSQPGVGTLAPTSQSGVQPVNYAGLVESGYANDQANANAAMGGLFGLGGSILGGLTKKFGIG